MEIQGDKVNVLMLKRIDCEALAQVIYLTLPLGYNAHTHTQRLTLVLLLSAGKIKYSD